MKILIKNLRLRTLLVFALTLFFLQPSLAHAEDTIPKDVQEDIQDNGAVVRHQFTKYILASSETGYITFFGGIGNIPTIWYEGKVVPNYVLRIRDDARFAAVITPKIVLRMFRASSNPVRTPSYMPQISFHYQVNEPSDFKNIFHLFLRFVHH
ncbi:hypothetical protein KAI87_16005, partial [Myxococcota bacterium]|nr:hypothetical protein [Myxococcota bacterium]